MTAIFPRNKTKIVCTIGPASRHPKILERMIRAGMNVARLNMAHGDTAYHEETIRQVRAAAAATGRRIAILADLPGPKMRLGKLPGPGRELRSDEPVTLTADPANADQNAITMDFQGLAEVVKPGTTIFLNDGFLQLQVKSVIGPHIHCRVQVGGVIRSHNGINVPGIIIPGSQFTANDQRLLEFVLQQNVDAVSISFVQNAQDVIQVRELSANLGKQPFLVAKIERANAVKCIDEILEAADAIMVARGDLGVETPIETIAMTQKLLIERANLLGKPVITATQMLESMVHNRRPTRAEATDVANAILDGTDCIMLSEESAIGNYPVDAVKTMAKIAHVTEAHHIEPRVRKDLLGKRRTDKRRVEDVVAIEVFTAVERLQPRLVIAPTDSGATPRRLSRFKLPYWIVAFSISEATCQQLCFTYGVVPIKMPASEQPWRQVTRAWCAEHGITTGRIVMTHGPSRTKPKDSNFVEVFSL